MADPIAVNDAGEALRFTNGAWAPAQIAVNDQTGERVAFDGTMWKPIGGKGATSQSPGNRVNNVPEQVSLPNTGPARAPGMVAQGSSDNETINPDETTAQSLLRRGGKALAYAGGVVDQTMRGVAQAGATVVGLPADAINLDLALSKRLGIPLSGASAVARLLGIDEVTAGTSGSINKALDAANRGTARMLDVDPPREQPRNAAERYGNRIGLELGVAAVPGAAALSKAGKVGIDGARRMANSGSTADRLFGGMVESAAVDPKKFVRREATTATVAGAGGQLGRDIVDPNGRGGAAANIADLTGAVGGVGLFGAANKMLRVGGDVAGALTNRPSLASDVVKQQVTDDLMRAVHANTLDNIPADTTSVVRKIREAPKVSDTIPGFTESLADRLQNDQLAAVEYGRQSGPNAGLFKQQRTKNTQAVDAALDEVTPQTPPGALREALEGQRDVMVGGANERMRAAQQAFEEAAARLQPNSNATARGANMRQALEEAQERARAVEREAWVPINEATTPVDMQGLADRFDNIFAGLSAAERQQFVPRDIAGLPAGLAENGPQALTEITGLRSAFTSRLRQLRNSGGDPNHERILRQYIDEIDAHLGEAIPPELRQAYDQARATSTDLNNRFTRPGTAVADTLRPTQGAYQAGVADSATSRRFVQPDSGRVSDTQALIREAGLDPRVGPAIRDQVLDDVQRGNTLANPARTERFVREHGTVLDHIPQTRDDLTGASRLNADAGAATEHYENLRRTLGDATMPGRSAVAKYLRYSDEKAVDAMKGVIASPNPKQSMDELLNFVGNDRAAVDGARKAFWDTATGRRGVREGGQPDGAWNGRNLKKVLDDPAHKAVLERLYRDDPDQLGRVRDIVEAIQGVDTRLSARAPNSSGTPQALQLAPGLTTASVTSAFYNVQRGIIGPLYAASHLVGMAARGAVGRQRADMGGKILDRALLDPEFAAALLAENNPANRAALARGAKGWMGNEAATFIELLNDLDGKKRDPVVDAVTRSGKADKKGAP